jgi:hypothetical protein
MNCEAVLTTARELKTEGHEENEAGKVPCIYKPSVSPNGRRTAPADAHRQLVNAPDKADTPEFWLNSIRGLA